MGKKKCKKCCFAAKASGYCECNYIMHNPRSRTVQAYEACGVDHPTPETDAMLDPETCAFFQQGERKPQPMYSVALPNSIHNTGPTYRYVGPIYDWGKAKRMHDKGATATEIARALGCTPHAVHDWRKREGLSNPRKTSRFDWGKARDMLAEGATIDQIAEALGCSGTTVQAWKRREGLQRLPADWETGRQMILAGKSVQFVAAALGLKPRTVEDYARREGLSWTYATDAPASQ